MDTGAVKDRVLYSMVPLPGKSFLQHHIRPKPDLYGPFWVCVTLVFSIAISGNMATYLQKSFEADENHPVKWHYDFHKVRKPKKTNLQIPLMKRSLYFKEDFVN